MLSVRLNKQIQMIIIVTHRSMSDHGWWSEVPLLAGFARTGEVVGVSEPWLTDGRSSIALLGWSFPVYKLSNERKATGYDILSD